MRAIIEHKKTAYLFRRINGKRKGDQSISIVRLTKRADWLSRRNYSEVELKRLRNIYISYNRVEQQN